MSALLCLALELPGSCEVSGACMSLPETQLHCLVLPGHQTPPEAPGDLCASSLRLLCPASPFRDCEELGGRHLLTNDCFPLHGVYKTAVAYWCIFIIDFFKERERKPTSI